jgi:hypothetical protein
MAAKPNAAFGLDEGESLGAPLSQGPTPSALAHLFTDPKASGGFRRRTSSGTSRPTSTRSAPR